MATLVAMQGRIILRGVDITDMVRSIEITSSVGSLMETTIHLYADVNVQTDAATRRQTFRIGCDPISQPAPARGIRLREDE